MVSFTENYEELEHSFRQQVKKDGDDSIYLPTIHPTECVDFLFIGMEPSLGHWAKDLEEAREKIRLGFKDFSYSILDFILHFCINQYLCYDGSKYHITNINNSGYLHIFYNFIYL